MPFQCNWTFPTYRLFFLEDSSVDSLRCRDSKGSMSTVCCLGELRVWQKSHGVIYCPVSSLPLVRKKSKISAFQLHLKASGFYCKMFPQSKWKQGHIAPCILFSWHRLWRHCANPPNELTSSSTNPRVYIRRIRKKNVFRRRKNRILPLRFGSPSASTEIVHRPRSQSPLHFDIGNI